MPIYKNKCSTNDPNNYRGISLLSCPGKLFPSCIKNLLIDYVKENNIIEPEQAGFHVYLECSSMVLKHVFESKILRSNKWRSIGLFSLSHRRSTRRKLAPLMLLIYLADLNNFLANKCTGLGYMNIIQEELLNNEFSIFS